MDAMQQSSEQPTIVIAGALVALGPVRRDLVPRYLRWINDFDVTRTLDIGMRPMTREAEEAWYERIAKTETGVTFTIYQRAGMRPIGNTDLRNLDFRNGTADFGIVIGEKDCWGRGYGTEATTLLLDYAFNALGLHNVMLQVYANNERGLRAYTRAGFRVIGRRREARRVGQQVLDIFLMDCLSTEFESPVLRPLLPEG